LTGLADRTIISNLPTLDSAPASLSALILKLNPHIYTPPFAHPTTEQAKTHIKQVDDALDLCARLLRLDVTKRLTAAQALRHLFFAQHRGEGEMVVEEGEDEVVKVGEGKCGRLHAVDADGKRESILAKKCRMWMGMTAEFLLSRSSIFWGPFVGDAVWHGRPPDEE
jgi:cell division control protein 7